MIRNHWRYVRDGGGMVTSMVAWGNVENRVTEIE